jgi:Domain of unknown function (DUF4126)
MEIFISIVLGICLSAASGFRIFVPFLVLSIAVFFGWINLGNGLWIGSSASLITFGLGATLEIVGYYNPWIDNMLDLLSTPLSIIAGMFLMSLVLDDLNFFLRWIFIIVFGGGAALYVQILSVKVRGLSSYFSSGNGNRIVTTIENISAIVISLSAILSPVAALIISLLTILSILKMTKIAKEKILI